MTPRAAGGPGRGPAANPRTMALALAALYAVKRGCQDRLFVA